ncbi:unnamed protein product [Scytosiphon promiscuus]
MATDNKYDRQLRLWGGGGQKALMEANILLVNASATGTETLKNLVLPGVGRFTILDAEDVQPLDQGSNFFVGPEHVGLPRAKVTTELLCEMNPDVKGQYVCEDPDSRMNKDPAFFCGFSLVIASQLHETTLRKMAGLCWEKSVPFLHVRSYGLLGHVRLALRGHCVVESKPEGNKPDLRISQPWPELLEYCRSMDLDKQDDMHHGHTPWIVILVRKMEEWKAGHDGALPSFQQRKEFQESLKAASRDYQKELNYQEAFKESYVAYAPPGLPSEVEALLATAEGLVVGPKTSNFWLLTRALGEFVKGEGGGLPPLSGEVPDMTSDTDSFITLQGLYKAKAAKDTAAVAALVEEGLAKAGRPQGSIPKGEVEIFCKNARKLLTMTTRSVEEEYGSDTCNKDEISCELGDPYEVPEQTPIVWYLALRAADAFKIKNGRYPGEEDEQVEGDGEELWKITQELLNGMGVETPHLTEKHAQEITRYGASELHNVASVVGGIASQEAVKAITRQYTPLDNTIVYNGLAGVIGRYEL